MSEAHLRKRTQLSKLDMDASSFHLARYLRLLQFLTTLVLFSIIVYMTSMPTRHISDISCILLICLTSSHLFFQSLDIMSFFSNHNVPESPMYIFSLIGMLLFAIAGILFLYYITSYSIRWIILVSMTLCFIISLLYTIEVMAVLLYWKKKYSALKKCHPLMIETQTLLSKACELPSSKVNFCRCEVTTSVSGQDLLNPTIDTVMHHETRKTNIAHRRQYVDSPSSVPDLSIMAIAQIQTENEVMNPAEAQTMKAQTKEIIIQTPRSMPVSESQILLPEPELSQSVPPNSITNTLQSPKTPNPMKISSRAQHHEMLSSCSKYQNSCAGFCPASVVILRGTMTGSCCGSCNCCLGDPDNYSALQCEHRSPSNRPI